MDARNGTWQDEVGGLRFRSWLIVAVWILTRLRVGELFAALTTVRSERASTSVDVVSYRQGDILRCGRCGNENPGSNRFCGMCGGSLLPAPAEVAPRAEDATLLQTGTPGPDPW